MSKNEIESLKLKIKVLELEIEKLKLNPPTQFHLYPPVVIPYQPSPQPLFPIPQSPWYSPTITCSTVKLSDIKAESSFTGN